MKYKIALLVLLTLLTLVIFSLVLAFIRMLPPGVFQACMGLFAILFFILIMLFIAGAVLVLIDKEG